MSTEPVRQFRRVFDILVGKASAGTGITANQEFRIKFEITKTIRHTPNHAEILIYNLSPATENTIKNEFDEVVVNAGYKGDSRLIFIGNLSRIRRYREGNEQVTQIIAADGDADYYDTIINTTLAAGTTASSALNKIVEQFKATKLGHAVAVTAMEGKRARGKVMIGPARDYLHQIAVTAAAHWSIQDGVLQFVPFEGTLQDEAIVINARTGMLKAPEINDKGIKVECLLNPALRPGGKVMLDNNDIKEEMRTEIERAAGAKKPGKGPKKPARTDPDGVYRLNSVTHKGDTRGTQWTSESLCVALSKPISPKQGE